MTNTRIGGGCKHDSSIWLFDILSSPLESASIHRLSKVSLGLKGGKITSFELNITLHIGNEKTGTTALQQYLADRFSDRRGVAYYPWAGRSKSSKHRQLYDDLADYGADAVTKYLVPDIESSSSECIVLSCELFSALNERSEQALRGFLEIAQEQHWKVSLICVVRPARPFLQSLYMEGLNWGWTDNFELFVRKHLRRLRVLLIKEVAESYGANVYFLRYDPESLLVSFINKAVPHAKGDRGNLPKANKTAPLWMAPFLLAANRTFGDSTFTRELRELAVGRYCGDSKSFDVNDFFSLSEETERAINQIETTDPIRSQLF